MEQEFSYEVFIKLKRQKRKKIWRKIVSVLICLVVFWTTYMLILPAITKETQIFCGIPEHSHSAECYREVLLCQTHVHTDTCYGESPLVCTQATEGHTHTEVCMPQTETALSCILEENAEHTHTEECYTTQVTYGCGLEESPPHVHGESCHGPPPLVCTIVTEDGHSHAETCYGQEVICGQAEHAHILQCYSDPEADVESPGQWEKTLQGVQLTGLHRQDLLAIARSQLDYRESDKNYLVREDGQTKDGYTRYGDWYGNAYGEWCAMFVSFCLHYAQVPDVPHQASCHMWVRTLETQGIYADAETYTPQPGDIVFIDWNADGYADHVGLVEEIKEDGTVVTIEGNRSNTVSRGEYPGQDPRLLGYGLVPEGEPHAVTAPTTGSAPPGGATEVPEATLTEQTIRAVIYTDETLRWRSEDETVILITGLLPVGATARAYPVKLDAGTLEGQTVLLAYDITIVDRNGDPVEDADEEKPFVVSIRPPGWTAKEDENYNVFFVPEEGEPERVETQSEETVVSFETNHFSTYALTATGNSATIYLNGSTGKDTNTGTSANAAVQTLDRALLLVKEGGTIYITGTVTVSDTQVWEMTNSVTIKRQSSFTGPLVTVTGGSLTLKNITIHGGSGTPSSSNIASNTTYASGSAKAPLIVVQSGAALHIQEGAVLEYNSNKPNTNSSSTTVSLSGYIGLGGAVYCQGELTMDGGTIRYCEALCGGGIYIESANSNYITFDLSGGTITYNYARDIVPIPSSGHKSYHKNAGGGVYVGDYVKMNMSGGTISNNQSSREGGGVSLGWLNRNNGSAISSYITYFYMTGGTFTGNVATSTGGGLNITAGRSAELVAGYFTENTANGMEYQPGDSDKYWTVYSGGAIYLDAKQTDSRGSYAGVPGYAKIHRVLVTDNSAGYYGGGIATCSTSSGTVNASVRLDGTLIYGNTASKGGNEMYLQGDVSIVGSTMLGGGTYSWTKSGYYYDNSLTENSASVQTGLPLATVIITGNYAGVDGGGIGCNGQVEIGGEPNTESISITKVWDDDGAAPHPESITVQVYKDGVAYGDPITMYPTVDENGNEIWPTVYVDGLPEGGKYTIKEVKVPGFESTVKESNGNFTITNTPVGFSVVKQWVGDTESDRPSSIQVQLLQNGVAYGEPVTLSAGNGWRYMWLNLPEGYNYSAREVEVPDGYYITDDGKLIDADTWQITNTKSPLTSISVEKRWEGEPADSVTVYLMCNGVQLQEATLSEENDWFYKWEDLPVYGKLADRLVYTVEEARLRGYEASVREATSADASIIWEPVTSMTSGGTYLLVSGSGALTVSDSGLAWTDANLVGEADTSQQWTYTDGQLRNGNGKYLYLNRSGSFLSYTYTFTAGSSGSDITYTNGYLRSGSSYSGRYFGSLGNDGTASASSSTSSATKFTIYERSTNEGSWGEEHYIVTNTKLPAAIAFHFVKYAVGSSGEPTLLAGAELALYRVSETGDITIPGTDQKGTLVRSWTSENALGADGGYHIEDLYSGTYYLFETATPKGYKGLDGPIIFTVYADTGQVTVVSAPYELSFENGEDVEFPIYNYATYELPRTGGMGTTGYTIGGLLLIFTAAVFLVYSKKRRREEHDSS